MIPSFLKQASFESQHTNTQIHKMRADALYLPSSSLYTTHYYIYALFPSRSRRNEPWPM